jgi:hypothetical protein
MLRAAADRWKEFRRFHAKPLPAQERVAEVFEVTHL